MELCISSGLNAFGRRGDHSLESMQEKIDNAGKVQGLTGIEINTPEHVNAMGAAQLREYLDERQLTVTCVNPRFDREPKWARGALSHPDVQVRQDAVDAAKFAVDTAAALGCGHICIWPGTDGFDYPFQQDYGRAWELLVTSLREVAAYNRDMQVDLEYKIWEPRRFSFVRDIGTTLEMIRDCDAANMGVTLDYAHVLMAKENITFAAALAQRSGRLANVHLNDGYGEADDGYIAGSTHLVETMELLQYLNAADYRGWLTFDLFPLHEDPVQFCQNSIDNVRWLNQLAVSMDPEELAALHQTMDANEVQRFVRKTMAGLVVPVR